MLLASVKKLTKNLVNGTLVVPKVRALEMLLASLKKLTKNLVPDGPEDYSWRFCPSVMVFGLGLPFVLFPEFTEKFGMGLKLLLHNTMGTITPRIICWIFCVTS